MAGVDQIRDVIAFPKTQRGQDLLVGAPSPVTEQQLRDLHIRVRPSDQVEDARWLRYTGHDQLAAVVLARSVRCRRAGVLLAVAAVGSDARSTRRRTCPTSRCSDAADGGAGDADAHRPRRSVSLPARWRRLRQPREAPAGTRARLLSRVHGADTRLAHARGPTHHLRWRCSKRRRVLLFRRSLPDFPRIRP